MYFNLKVKQVKDSSSELNLPLAHRGVLSHLPMQTAHFRTFLFQAFKKTKKSLTKKLNYPTVGATFFYGSVGNNEILGRYTALYGFGVFPYF